MVLSNILVIHRDAHQRRMLEERLTGLRYQARSAASMAQAMPSFDSAAIARIALVLADAALPEQDIEILLTRMREQPAPPHLVAITPETQTEAAMRLLRLGAIDYITLPLQGERFALTIRNALRLVELEAELKQSEHRAQGMARFCDIIAAAPAMKRVLELAQKATASQLPVLLEGESGVGKELLARAIHGESRRADKPFLRLSPIANVAGVSELEEKLEQADGGTLFIADIGEASPAFQMKLLELVSNQENLAVRNAQTMSDARIVCATSLDLIALVKNGQFREDLFYRLNILPIAIPPLRNRKEDIPALLDRFALRASIEQSKTITGVDHEAVALARAYSWPGNVQQLENAVYRAVALADGPVIGIKDFPQIAALVPGFQVEIPPEPRPQMKPVYEGPAMIGKGVPYVETMVLRHRPAPHNLGIPALNEEGDVRPLTEMEADMIRLALGHYRGHMTEVARKLGIGRSTLYRKMREFGLDFRLH